MAEPQLRCLLCDLILADANARDQPTETCQQCGRKVLAGQAVEGEVELQPLNPPSRSQPLDLDIDLLPEAAVVPPPPGSRGGPPPDPQPIPTTKRADEIPSVPVLSKARRAQPDVPTVSPGGKITTDPGGVPYTARRAVEPPSHRATATKPPPAAPAVGKAIPQFPPRRVTVPGPPRVTQAAPRPKVFRAFAVLGCMTVLAVAAIVVIISCIVIGLRMASKTAAYPVSPASEVRT